MTAAGSGPGPDIPRQREPRRRCRASVRTSPRVLALATVLLAQAAWLPAGLAQGGAASAKAEPRPVADYAVLTGRWLRPDGGYLIVIQSVAPDGTLSAGYANPSLLPFAVAQATRKDGALQVFLELRAGGYNGSTYTLAYDPAQDVLKGVYYQAVAKQKFDVVFVRSK